MTREEMQPAILGLTCRVEMCACGRALVLSMGPVSVRLDVAAAEDVATTLAFAIQRCAARPDCGGRRPAAADPEQDEWDVLTLPEAPVPDPN